MFIDFSSIPLNRQQHKKVVRIIHNLLNLPESIPFRKPVCYRALGLDDYKKIVKKPIDLNMIRRTNNEWKYKFVEQVFDDIQLCWNNCRAYNKPQSDIYEAAVKMENHFVDQLLQQYPGYIIPQGIIIGREKQSIRDKQKEKEKSYDQQKQISTAKIENNRFQSQSITNPASSQKLEFKELYRQKRGQSKQIRQIREQRQRQRLLKQQKQRQARYARQIREKQRQIRLAKQSKQRQLRSNELNTLQGVQSSGIKQQINFNQQKLNQQAFQSFSEKQIRKDKRQLKLQKSQKKQQQKNLELQEKEQEQIENNKEINENSQNQFKQSNQINEFQINKQVQQDMQSQIQIQKSNYEKINEITYQLKKISNLKVLREIIEIITNMEPSMVHSKEHRHKIVASSLQSSTINQIANFLSKFEHK